MVLIPIVHLHTILIRKNIFHWLLVEACFLIKIVRKAHDWIWNCSRGHMLKSPTLPTLPCCGSPPQWYLLKCKKPNSS